MNNPIIDLDNLEKSLKFNRQIRQKELEYLAILISNFTDQLIQNINQTARTYSNYFEDNDSSLEDFLEMYEMTIKNMKTKVSGE